MPNYFLKFTKKNSYSNSTFYHQIHTKSNLFTKQKFQNSQLSHINKHFKPKQSNFRPFSAPFNNNFSRQNIHNSIIAQSSDSKTMCRKFKKINLTKFRCNVICKFALGYISRNVIWCAGVVKDIRFWSIDRCFKKFLINHFCEESVAGVMMYLRRQRSNMIEKKVFVCF